MNPVSRLRFQSATCFLRRCDEEWHESETLCKMEWEQFAEGAMRRCFRMKKLSQSMQSAFIKLDWRHCPNYVAKEYKVRWAGGALRESRHRRDRSTLCS